MSNTFQRQKIKSINRENNTTLNFLLHNLFSIINILIALQSKLKQFLKFLNLVKPSLSFRLCT